MKGSLKIFNRWGKCIFATNDLVQGWDGTHKGVPVPTGVYYWLLVYTGVEDFLKVEKQQEGAVTVLR